MNRFGDLLQRDQGARPAQHCIRRRQPRDDVCDDHLLCGRPLRARFDDRRLHRGLCLSHPVRAGKADNLQFENFSTWSSSASFLLAFTAPMWTLTGYDSAAHVAEEVINAAVVAPLAIVSAVSATWVLGLALLISASYTILDVGGLLGSSLSLPMAQLYYNVLGKHGMLAIWSCVSRLSAARMSIDTSQLRDHRAVCLRCGPARGRLPRRVRLLSRRRAPRLQVLEAHPQLHLHARQCRRLCRPRCRFVLDPISESRC